MDKTQPKDPRNLQEHLAAKLKELRGDRTQDEVVEATGVAKRAYCDWEKGESLPKLQGLAALAKFYKMPLWKMFV